mmetsp:Transcript_34690/g.79953  ORF Transcript_34690/g.79953 Transcript_34690/m.79953 type:complete len:136 (-) Transcript_34690:40-447(-)
MKTASMSHGPRCKCGACGRRGAAQARRFALRALRSMPKPGRLGRLARQRAGLDPPEKVARQTKRAPLEDEGASVSDVEMFAALGNGGDAPGHDPMQWIMEAIRSAEEAAVEAEEFAAVALQAAEEAMIAGRWWLL